jgi:hypothetical protein
VDCDKTIERLNAAYNMRLFFDLLRFGKFFDREQIFLVGTDVTRLQRRGLDWGGNFSTGWK